MTPNNSTISSIILNLFLKLVECEICEICETSVHLMYNSNIFQQSKTEILNCKKYKTLKNGKNGNRKSTYIQNQKDTAERFYKIDLTVQRHFNIYILRMKQILLNVSYISLM